MIQKQVFVNKLRSHKPIIASFLDPITPLSCNICSHWISESPKFYEIKSANPFVLAKNYLDFLTKRLFCLPCLEKILSSRHTHTNICYHCGSDSLHQCPCQILTSKRPVTRFRSLFVYNLYIRDLIFRIKFNPSLDLVNWAALLIFVNLPFLFEKKSSACTGLCWDSISFIPSRMENIKLRGGYSTYLITKVLAQLIGNLPIIFTENSSLNRQSSQSTKDRIKQKRDFSIRREMHNVERILLFDDMLTSGISAVSLAEKFSKSGQNHKIDVLTLSRSLDFRKNYFMLNKRCEGF